MVIKYCQALVGKHQKNNFLLEFSRDPDINTHYGSIHFWYGHGKIKHKDETGY